MTLDDLLNVVITGTAEDWHVIGCWGYGTGPSYRYALQNVTRHSPSGPITYVEVTSHAMTATLKRDVDIAIAWGLTSLEDFQEPWAQSFPDPQASSSFVDIFYRGNLVFRETYVSVDGGRVKLPIPEIHDGKLLVSGRYVALVRLLNMLEPAYEKDFGKYMVRANIAVGNVAWPAP